MLNTLRSSVLALGLAAIVAAPPALAQSTVSEGELDRALTTADALSLAFEHAANVAAPSVVNVRAAARIAASSNSQGFVTPFQDPRFRQFFGDDFFGQFNIPQPDQSQGFVRQGQGTGFVVSEDGLILTNNHVVDDATSVTVQFGGGQEYDAEVVGTDPSTDLALLRIDATGLTPVKFADSEGVRVGEWVVAVGNPFGLESTITAGIVSAVGRTRVGIAAYEDFIQTDAAVNPGNSGGPLVNLHGEVIGVNTAIATRNGGNMGIGFSIPSNLATSIMQKLRDDGAVSRGWLGVMIQDLDEGLAQSFGFDGSEGVLVSQVQDGSPAEKAGLKTGDIITEFDGAPLTGMDQLRMKVAATDPGSSVKLTVFRDGKRKTIGVDIGELESEGSQAQGKPVGDELGLGLRDFDDAMSQQLGTDAEYGVVVTSVDPLSAGGRAGLRVRDVITHVQDTAVHGTREFRKALGTHDLTKGVRLTVRTGDAQRFVFLKESPATEH